jgi:hypothetical protein
MRNPALQALALAYSFLAMTGCGLDSASDGQGQDSRSPYLGMACQETFTKMLAEVETYNAGHADAMPGVPIARAYPPVAGVDPSFYDSSGVPRDGSADIFWIPPAGFGRDSILPDSLSDSAVESAHIERLPRNVSTVEIISTSAYVCHVRIFDYKNRLIAQFQQDFGHHGEMRNPSRAMPMGMASFLAWDTEAGGLHVDGGIYRWEIVFDLPDGSTQNRGVETGWAGDRCL